MQLPVVSAQDSWKWKKAKYLRKFKDSAREFIYIFALWNKSLQQIGGELLTVYVEMLKLKRLCESVDPGLCELFSIKTVVEVNNPYMNKMKNI